MGFLALSCYLASLLATLVLVVTSLPQSPSVPPDGISNQGLSNVPFELPRGCPKVGAIDYQHDIGGELVRRDTLSSETPARALDPRRHSTLPCGRLHGGGQTNPFTIATSQTLRLVWSFVNALMAHVVVMLMEVSPHGLDLIVGIAAAATIQIIDFRPRRGREYYILMNGSPQILMRWCFSNM